MRDRFGRLLGYLWLQDTDESTWVLYEHLAAETYAIQLTIQLNSRYADRFAAAVQSARDQGLGLGIACMAPAPSTAPLSGAMSVPPAPRVRPARARGADLQRGLSDGVHPAPPRPIWTARTSRIAGLMFCRPIRTGSTGPRWHWVQTVTV